MSLKRILYSLLIALAAALAGCDDGDNGSATSGSIDLEFTAAPIQGFAPLTVTLSTDMPQEGMVWDFGDGSPTVTDVRRLDHTFELPGVYTVSLSVTDESGNVTSTTREITANASVNLVVTNFAISATATTSPTTTLASSPGYFNTVSATIQNIGTGPVAGSGLLHVGYYLSKDQNITVDDIYIGDTSIVLGSNELVPGQFGVPQLGPQEQYSYVHALANKGNIPNGNYYAGAIVDYIDRYDWYDFPSATDTLEYSYPSHVTVTETNENDNVSPLQQVTVSSTVCTRDMYENDDNAANATVLGIDTTQTHNLCFDNSDWFQFSAVEGNVYKVTVNVVDGTAGEVDPQLILYDQNAKDILLFQDNRNNFPTVDLGSGWCTGDIDPVTLESNPNTHFCAGSSIVWKATATGTYFLKVRTATCDEDQDDYCQDASPGDIDPTNPITNPNTSPDGVGNNTGYTITLQ